VGQKVIELIRESTEEQSDDDHAGIPAQREINRRTAQTYHLDIIDTIEIVDVSGASVLKSPEMQRLLRMIDDKQIHGVVTREFSRLMRPENFSDLILLQSFVDSGTTLYLEDGPIDLASKTGHLFGLIRAGLAGYERREMLDRVWSAKEAKRRAGKHPQSHITLPFGVGYDREKELWSYMYPEAQKVLKAFQLFLAGEASYWEVGRKLDISPFNLRVILRNPIYTGWRVYTQKRDPSPKGRRLRPDGRQGDRAKIPREPDEVFRVKVLDPPLISEADFCRVQQLLDMKKQNHWRCRPNYEHRFVYHGFLRCGHCGNLVYTHHRAPHDWYVCKSRTTAERKLRERRYLAPCTNPYMRRERLETTIDLLFSERLRDSGFLEKVADTYRARCEAPRNTSDLVGAKRGLARLELKRKRVVNAYCECLISWKEKKERLSKIEAEAKFYRDLAGKPEPIVQQVSGKDLAEALSPFVEWDTLTTPKKRRLLQATVPEIHVRDYQVIGLSLLTPAIRRNDLTHTGRGSWRRPA